MLPLSHLHLLLAIRSAGPPRTRPKSGDDPCMYSGIEHGHEFTAGVVRFMFKKNSRLRDQTQARSEEHTSELQSLMRISYAVFCLKKKNKHKNNNYILRE